MKTISMLLTSQRIGGTEFRAMFFSPVAWIVLAVFLIQSFAAVIDQIERIAEVRFVHGDVLSITSQAFTMSPSSLFREIGQSLVFYIPLLTMGVYAREYSSGSIRLLGSAPVSLIQIVLGKYLGIVYFILLLTSVLIALVAGSAIFIANLDYGWLASACLGFFLVACAYGAVGTFVSSLTSQQLVAAIGTIAMLAVLTVISSFGQRLPLIGEAAYWLAIGDRATEFRFGLIQTKDVFYFLTVIAMFLSFTWVRLAADRNGWTYVRQLLGYGAVGALLVVVGYLFSLPQASTHFDTTVRKHNLLSVASQEIMADINGEWEVEIFSNVLDSEASRFRPRYRRAIIERLFQRYLRQNYRMSNEFVYYFAKTDATALSESNQELDAREMAQRYASELNLDFQGFLDPTQVSREFDLQAEQRRNLLKVSWNGRSEIIRTFDDVAFFPGEGEISAAMSRLIQGPEVVGFAEGNGERSAYQRGPSNYVGELTNITYRDALVNNGFNFVPLSLDQNIPEEVSTLVIAAPRSPYTESEVGTIVSYLEGGGDLLIMFEPNQKTGLEQVFARLGITVHELAFESVEHPEPDRLTVAEVTDKALDSGFGIPGKSLIGRVVLPGAGRLEVESSDDFSAFPLLGKTTGEIFAVALERKGSSTGSDAQRIIIVSDADFMSTGTVNSSDLGGIVNPFFVDAMFYWLSDDRYPVPTARPPSKDVAMAFSIGDIVYLRYVAYLLLPAVLLLMAMAYLTNRRRA